MELLRSKTVSLQQCDVSKKNQIDEASLNLGSFAWDVLVLAPGLTTPIGPFPGCDIDEWTHSVEVNFTNQLRLVHRMLPTRRISSPSPTVLFFAGGGTNSAPTLYSAYTVSKIALIKMTELLAAEIPDTKFVIVGPGWVKTKIHDQTIAAGEDAGSNLKRTIEKLEGDTCTPMQSIVNCCNWLIEGPREILSGRNYSVVGDKWGTHELEVRLSASRDMYKLRRLANDR